MLTANFRPLLQESGTAELRRAFAGNRRVIAAVIVFSAFVNLLGLTGPLFMLQVYDRVLASRSQETLTALLLLAGLLFLIVGLLDAARGWLMSWIAAIFQDRVQARVLTAALATPSRATPGGAGLRDLDDLHQVLQGAAMRALIDLPWAPFYVLALFLLHPVVGATALAGALLLIALAGATQVLTRRAARDGTAQADALAESLGSGADQAGAVGVLSGAVVRWTTLRRQETGQAAIAANRALGLAAASRTARQALQCVMLAVGAHLVLKDQLTAGAMVATSVMLGRALTPVDQAIAGWDQLQRGRRAWERLARLLGGSPDIGGRLPLPRPRPMLQVENLTVCPPGASAPVLHGISFDLQPGQALGVIGPCGSGKSTLARSITGHWPPLAGRIRLGGAPLGQYGGALAGHIGYLPQRVRLFDGTIAENIARLDPTPDPAAVIAAARAAGAHEMILDLPEGYDTRIAASGAALSGGQIQRIGLARALFGDPAVMVLDEPDAHLDRAAAAALTTAVRRVLAANRAVLIMAHRPSMLRDCGRVLVLDRGRATAFGPRETVLGGLTASPAAGRIHPTRPFTRQEATG